ncbi:g5339 [Coccomyxa elongata]
MADWRQILEPRVIDSGCKITIEMLVRAFAEQPSTSLNSQERGPRLTAHLVCWLTNQVRRLSDELRYAHSQLAATNTRLERAQQTIKEHKAEWVSAHQQIKRQMSALEHKLARHLNAKANAPQSQAQPQPESVEAEPELSAKLAGDDAWNPNVGAEEEQPGPSKPLPPMPTWGALKSAAPAQAEEGEIQSAAEDDRSMTEADAPAAAATGAGAAAATDAAATATGPINQEMLKNAVAQALADAGVTSEPPTKRARTGEAIQAEDTPVQDDTPAKEVPFAT